MTSGVGALLVKVGRVGSRSWGCVQGQKRGESAGEGAGRCWSWGGKGSCPVPSGEGQDGRHRQGAQLPRRFLFPEV